MVAFTAVLRRLAIFSITLIAVVLFLPRFASSFSFLSVAHAGPAEATSILAEAERADQALELAKALASYEAALYEDPTMSKAMLAEQRAKTLRAHAEGDFKPLAMLERVRRDPALASDPHAIDELVKAANDFPPGLVRIEARILAAEAYASRLGRPNDAPPLWRLIALDEKAEPVMRHAAIRSLATFHLARGNDAEALAAVDLDRDPKDEQLAKWVRRSVRRHKLHYASIVVIGLMLVLTAAALVRAGRSDRLKAVIARARGSAKLIIGYGAYTAIAGALLATGYESGTAKPFVLFGVALVPLLFLARAWSAAGSGGGSARAVRASLCAASALSVAFLVLEHVDVSYLEGIGL